MRRLLSTFAIAVLATPALAGSVERLVPGDQSEKSVEVISCDHCPALKEEQKAHSYNVGEIAPGTQKIEIRDVNGEKKMFRTEAWFGGSPVVFVNTAPDQPSAAAKAEPQAADTAVDAAITPVDSNLKTGALDAAAASGAMPANAASAGESREFDPSRFELRLN
ncbi:plant virulence effector HPE1-like domain-containing protein [Sinorhizobium sp. BG8]|uniref:plant virulence effector HPE1-like domain-containing protein n=1 Tax=Sinorhizobium sp. BG8 TaxID=2613773 RepID=UPI00193E8204|nr:plant virulence effector HPE1-like domain-containing protein [Sinorhizobium sp. BG8]QRM54522.1 hypothetical protein F3Y30_08155 [Sinorhizobium sp. BG8]